MYACSKKTVYNKYDAYYENDENDNDDDKILEQKK